MRTLSSVVLATVVVLSVGAARCAIPGQSNPVESNQWSAGTAGHVVRVGDHLRDFRLHIPKARARNRIGLAQAYGLVIVLHGSGADGETVRHQSGMDSVAEANGWVVAYPDGVKGTLGFGSDWNVGTCCGVAARDSIDDVRFAVAIIDYVVAKLPVSRGRVYVAGFSDGARMAYHIACQAALRVAAVAVVSGSVRDPNCVPARAVPLIAFHGTADDEVPYGEPPDTHPRQPPIQVAAGLPPSVQMWASSNGCRGLTHALQAKHVTRFSFTQCKADVVMYSVAGGGHGWPGEPDGVGSTAPMSEIHATPLIARFFNTHAR